METRTPYDASAVPPAPAYFHDQTDDEPMIPLDNDAPPQYPAEYPPQYQPKANQGYTNGAYQPTMVQPGQTNSTQPVNVVIIQQQPIIGQMDERVRKITDLLPLSIITTLFCSLLFGLIAIRFSLRVRAKKQCNDYEGAKHEQKSAIAMNVIAIVVGIICIVIFSLRMAASVEAATQSVAPNQNYYNAYSSSNNNHGSI